jgi:hypothetical protein
MERKILLKYRFENNYVEAFKKLYGMFDLGTKMSKSKPFAVKLSCSGILRNYFDGPT